MSKRHIRYIGDPVLRKKAEPVKKVTAEIRNLIQDMFETMEKEDGAGLAAPQVGISRQVIVYDVRVDEDGKRERRALVNPEIVSYSEKREATEEGCLSLPGIHVGVERAHGVKVRALDEKGKKVVIEATEMHARVLQHEIDHLHGIFFSDRAGIPEGTAKQIVDQFRVENHHLPGSGDI